MNSKQKGKRGELEAAAAIRAAWGIDARRGQQFRGGPDSPDVVGIPGLHVEVKRTERLRMDEAMAQAIKDAGPQEVPTVLYKRNRGPWLMIVQLTDLHDAAFMVTKAQAESRQPSGNPG